MELLTGLLGTLWIFLKNPLILFFVPVLFGLLYWILIIELKIIGKFESLPVFFLFLIPMFRLIFYLDEHFVRSGYSSLKIYAVALIANMAFIAMMSLLHGADQPPCPE